MQDKNEKTNDPVGYIDWLSSDGLTGWFYSGSDTSGVVQLSLEGEIVTSAEASNPRPDVAAEYGFGENTGFTFDLYALEEVGEIGKIFEFTIHDINKVFNFHGAIVRYCVGTAKWFREIQAIFDADFYRSKYDLCHFSKEEAFKHFIEDGMLERYDPCPWFSNSFYIENYPQNLLADKLPLIVYLENESKLEEKPANNFDPEYYLRTYPHLEGTRSLLAHFVAHGRFEGWMACSGCLPEVVRSEFEDILHLEPKLSSARTGLDLVVRYPHHNNTLYLSRLIHRKVGDEIKVVLCVPFISRGGADLISTFLFSAYQAKYGKDQVLMLVTDSSSIDVPEWIDEGSHVICLDDEATFHSAEDKLLALHSSIGKIAPEKIVNVNSNLTWQLFDRHGVQLSSVVDLYAFLFCFDYNKERDQVGYIVDYLPKTLRNLKKVYFDNKKIIEDVQNIYGFSSELRKKMHTVYVPAAEGVKSTDFTDHEKRDTVLWVGRLSLQKRPDILVEIAKILPEQQFDVYGPPGNSDSSSDIVEGKISNITYRGVYNSLEEIDYTKYSSFLNTSEWDGLPTVIIQMMAIGLPIVTSMVCGIPELVNEDNGWPVYSFDDPAEYAKSLRKVNIQKKLVLEKQKLASSDVLVIHSRRSFYERLERLEAFSDFSNSARINAPFMDRRRTA